MPAVVAEEGVSALLNYGFQGIFCFILVVGIRYVYMELQKSNKKSETQIVQLMALVSSNMKAMEGMAERMEHLSTAIEDIVKSSLKKPRSRLRKRSRARQ